MADQTVAGAERDRINHMETKLNRIAKEQGDMFSRFAWLHHAKGKRCFAILTGPIRTVKRPNRMGFQEEMVVADLIAFHHELAGGVWANPDVQMFIAAPDVADEEQDRLSKWEPIIDIQATIDEADQEARLKNKIKLTAGKKAEAPSVNPDAAEA